MDGPQFVRFFWPVLAALKELGNSGRPSEVVELIAEWMNVDDDVRDDLLDSGAKRFDNQIHWARFYLVKSDYIDSSKRGVWSLTEKGRSISDMSDNEALRIFRDVQSEWKNKEIIKDFSLERDNETQIDDLAPVDEFSSDRREYRSKLLHLIQSLPPAGFESLCQELLRESGFQEVIVTGKTGDGGIDGHGILEINPFVRFKVMFQSKRYKGSVSVSQVRDFRGAIMGRADKGIVITTGTFTPDARREALRDGASSIELIDGEKLLNMFVDLQLGLIPKQTFDIDYDYFEKFRD